MSIRKRFAGVALMAFYLAIISRCQGASRLPCLTNLTNLTIFGAPTEAPTANTNLLFYGAYENTKKHEEEALGDGTFEYFNDTSIEDAVEAFNSGSSSEVRYVRPTLFDSNTRRAADQTEPGMQIGISGIADLGPDVRQAEEGTSILNERIFSTPLIAGSLTSATNYNGLTPLIVADFVDVDALVNDLVKYNLSSIFIDVSTLGDDLYKAAFMSAARTLADLNSLKVVALAVTDVDVAIAANGRADLISQMPTESLSNLTIDSLFNNSVSVATVLNTGSSVEQAAKQANFDLLLNAGVSMGTQAFSCPFCDPHAGIAVFGTGHGSLINASVVPVKNATLEEIEVVQAALELSNATTADQKFYEISTANPAQLWAGVLWSPFYTGGVPVAGVGASFYATSNENVTWAQLFDSSIETLAYVKGNIQPYGSFASCDDSNYKPKLCWQCNPGFKEQDVNDDVERIVAVIVPTLFIAMLYTFITAGVAYHFVVRNNALQVPPGHKFVELQHVRALDDIPKTLL